MVGEVLGHYRVVEKIGAGGVGEVYRARDEQLDREVALKVLPAGTLAGEAARRHFRKEALALAKLNHPNIETIFEFSSQDGVDFLAMELIPGHLLSEKLKQGPLAEKEVSRLGMQLAEGLAAAHEHGIVHCDLKPTNLFVTPVGRLKILDFGLAKLVRPELSNDITQSTSKESSTICGTVPYMSPEQLRGQSVDARSDIYAAGVVLYEMATGQRPFPQTQSAELMGAILHQSPTPPSSVNPDVSSGLERSILKALEKDASQRYQSARELLAALEGISSGVIEEPARRRTGPSRRATIVAASAALAIVIVVGFVLGLNVRGIREYKSRRNHLEPTGRATTPSAPIHARRSVAVLGFKNLSGRSDEMWLSTALSEMLATELAAGDQLRMVPGENVARMKIDLSLPDADSYGRETLAKIHNNLNADDVVLGSYVPLGKGQIRLDLRLQDTVGGDTVVAVSEKGSEEQIDDLVSRAGAALREKLGVGPVSKAEAVTVKAILPSNPAAVRLYSDGLAKLRAFDNLTARDLLQKAVAAEPNFALAHSALASAWKNLGYDAKAREESKKAVDLSTSLGPEERLWVEGQYQETAHDWEKAIHIYSALVAFFPDNLDYGLSLADAQVYGGKADEALVTITQLRRMPSPAGDDPRIDLREAFAAEWAGDPNRAQSAAFRAAEKGTSSGSRLIVALAKKFEGASSGELGDRKRALAAYEESSRLFIDAGDKGQACYSLLQIGRMRSHTGEISQGMKSFEQALRIAKEIGAGRNTAMAQQYIADLLVSQGELGKARTIYEETLKLYRELGEKSDVIITLGHLGNTLADLGDFRRAQDLIQEAVQMAREIHDRSFLSDNLMNLGDLLVREGNLKASRASYEEALAISHEMTLKWGIASGLSGIGDILLIQGDLAGSRRDKEEALKVYQEESDQAGSLAVQVDLARDLIEEGQPAEAELLARRSAKDFAALQMKDNETIAVLVLARALFVQGKIADAKTTMRRARTLRPKSQSATMNVDMDTVAASIGASEKPAEAVKSLETAIATAAKLGYVPGEFEARLALGEVEMEAGKEANGRDLLATLEKDATASGFLLIARKAAAANK
jgi:serine/threonine protein kinase/tetratricopeptide (TPR) repeat protein